jgi:ABC-2 type transport system ATP-binding protein
MMTTANLPIIEVDGLSYEYPGKRALDGVCFALEAGSITALVGPNGAGKTTLLRCLAGLDQPLSGRITVNGCDVISEPRRSHAEIGYLSDAFGLYARLSVRRCISYAANANAVATLDVHARVEKIAADVGLQEHLERPAGELSRGLRQRVAIAQAVIHAPKVILLDEPASGLDPEARYQLGELFVALAKRGMTLLVSSHILSELDAYSSDMLILRGGRVVEQRRLAGDAATASVLEIATLDDGVKVLAALEGDARVSAIISGEATIHCHFAGSDAERASLLRTLVQQGVQISHFAVLGENLQQSYLRSIKDSERAQ